MRLLATIITILVSSISMRMSADVRGIVLDENKNPIAGATVIASALPDSTFVNGAITGADGRFDIKTSLDRVALKVSFLGYETAVMLATDNAQNSVQLQPDAKELSEVTVIANGIKYKAGGYTAKLNNSRLTEGKEAPQLLAYLPGISEKDGEINVLTRKPAAIYVDGIKINSQEELKAITAS
ncbi:MAG: carboxypeptidase-like regulatory domain-containing protein, partial [Muribaculaceae bacterium]|nr:carboxypeptidase-like regulatory domain-containing protein [Muribaculaceae bacterium]